MTTSTPSKSHVSGILFVLSAMTFLSLQDLIIKFLSGDYPLHEIIFIRSFIAIFLAVLFARMEGGFRLLLTKRIGLHLARGLLLVVTNVTYFLALAGMPLADAVAVFFVAPLFITILAAILLSEQVGPNRWFAVGLGLLGVIVMLKPGSSVFQWIAILPVIAAFTYALMVIITRRMSATDNASAMSFWTQLMFFCVSSVFGLIAGDGHLSGNGHPSLEFLLRAWMWPDQRDLLLFIACGTLLGTAGYLMSRAYLAAEANLVAPFEYVALPMAVLWGYLMWGDIPEPVSWIGMSMIIGGGLIVYYRENMRGRLLAARRLIPLNR
jgi:S-adenosylmethionine uptake transporter